MPFRGAVLHDLFIGASGTAGILGAWDWNIGSDSIHATRGVAKLLNIAPDVADRDGYAFADFLAAVHPDDRQRVEKANQDAVYRGGEYICEYRILTPSGERPVLALGRCFLDAEGKPERFPGIIIDMSNRAQRPRGQAHAIQAHCEAALALSESPIVTQLLKMTLLQITEEKFASSPRFTGLDS